MEKGKGKPHTCRLNSFDREVLERYETADESGRMDMYMTYRELRDSFAKIEAGSPASTWTC